MSNGTPAAGGLSTQAPGFVRTLVPVIIGPLAARFGFNATDPTTLMYTSMIASYVYYVVVRILENYFPTLGFLLGIAKQPVYSTAAAPSPGAGEDVVAVVVDSDDAAAADAADGAEVGPVDEPPGDKVFRDWDGVQHDPDVVAEGNRLGEETPDVDFIETADGKVEGL